MLRATENDEADLPLYLQVIARNFWAKHSAPGYGGETDEVSAANESHTLSVHLHTTSGASASSGEAIAETRNNAPLKRHMKQQSLPIFKHNSSPHVRAVTGPHFSLMPHSSHMFTHIREEVEQESLQMISDLPSSDEETPNAPALIDSPEPTRKVLSPGSRFGLSSTKGSVLTGGEMRTSSTSIDQAFEPIKWPSTLETTVERSESLLELDLKSKALRFKYEAKIKAERAVREHFGMLPTTAYCEHCRSDVSTRVSLELPKFPSWKGWCLARELLSCCSEPDVLPRYQDIRHYCRRCRRLLAEVTPGH